MRSIVMITAMLAAGATAGAEQTVRVYLTSDINPSGVLYQAQQIVAHQFAKIGVRIAWLYLGQAHSDWGPAIIVGLAERTPSNHLPGALAEAKVYEGIHITVFWDRIEGHSRLAPASLVLADVLIHEITHVLQRIDRHSESGVMKAQWTVEDYHAMASKPLPFTPLDVELIQRGLAPQPVAIASANSAVKIPN